LSARAAIRHQRRFQPGLSFRQRDIRLGHAARLLPRSLVILLSAAVFAVASFALGWTFAVHGESVMAEAESPAATGSVKAN
jgi:hypothetical protein